MSRKCLPAIKEQAKHSWGFLLSITASLLQRWTEVSSPWEKSTRFTAGPEGPAPKAGNSTQPFRGSVFSCVHTGPRQRASCFWRRPCWSAPTFQLALGTLSPCQTHTGPVSTCAPSTHSSGGVQGVRRAHTALGAHTHPFSIPGVSLYWHLGFCSSRHIPSVTSC